MNGEKLGTKMWHGITAPIVDKLNNYFWWYWDWKLIGLIALGVFIALIIFWFWYNFIR